MQEIADERQYAKILRDGKHLLAQTKYWVLLPLALLIVWSGYACSRGLSPATILTLWTVGSFFLYMFYFFLMMIPSVGSGPVLRHSGAKTRQTIREFLRLANLVQTVRSNKVTLLEIFLNAFLINTKPLAKGFAVVYLSDLIVATLLLLKGLLDADVYLMIVVQIVVIMAFYAKILLAEPDTPGFFVGMNICEAVHGETYLSKLKILIYISVFGMFTGLLIIGAMLFPGLTLAEYLSGLAYIPSEYPVILLLSLLSQAVILRYLQGTESRNLMEELNRCHCRFLETDLLPRIRNADDGEMDSLRREFLLLSMNKLTVQAFFTRFPAYVLVPNLFLIADPAAQEILDKTGDEKGILELL
jgi:hypothetical protein